MDSYVKLRVIGKGSYGEVWLVKHKKDRKQYVLKRMEISNASRRERKAAEQEAKLLAKLKHPNICSYKDSFETDNGMLYIAMGYCEGGDLYTRLKEQKNVPLEESQVVEWFVQIAMALQYMHERNILHRDLKTQNIFLTKSKIIKVGDLGIARVLDSSSDMATTLIGTPYYMGPELFSNKPYNHKSDVWALGCCVYEMATLKHAFNARDMNSLVYKILRGKMPPMPRQYSPELVTLIKAMLNSKPERRPSVNRILRDPYIKRNIAIFLESTRKHGSNRSANSNNRSSDNHPTRPSSEAPRRHSEDVPDSSRSSVSSVSSVSRAYDKVSNSKSHLSVDENLEPLEVGPDLAPIIEEPTPRASSENLLGSGDSRRSNRSRSNTPTRSRPPTPSKPHSHSEPRNLPPSGCDNVSRHALKKKKQRYKREAELNHVNRSSGQDRERVPSPHRGHNPHESPTRCEDHKQAKNNSVFNNAKPVEKPRPLPPRPAPMSQEPAASSAVPKRSQSRKTGMSEKEESGYGSISSSVNSSKDDNTGRDDDTPRQSVNLSARARRREKKGTETPRTSRSVDITPRGDRLRPKSGGVSKSADYPIREPTSSSKARPRSANTENPRRSSASESEGPLVKQPSITEESSSSESETEGDIVMPEKSEKDRHRPTHIVISESHSAISRRHSAPAIQSEDSVDGSLKDTDVDTMENEEYRKDKEMNNFISLLNHTLQMNKKGPAESHSKASTSSDEEDVDCVDGVIPELPEQEAEAESAAEIVVSEFSYEPIRRPDPARPHAPVKTLGTSTRLMDRITVLRKDCIRALGVEKMKRAYDILDEVDGDEIEDELVKVLGRMDFDVYAGKIWQLKFCEEAAFGII